MHLSPKTYHPKPNAGFTLIELMIVVSIMLVLTTILAGHSRQGAEQVLLASAQARLLSLFSHAKFLSVQMFFQDHNGPRVDGVICAYGVSVDQSTGEIFIFQERVPVAASCPGNNLYDPINDVRLDGRANSMKLDPARLRFGDATSLSDIIFIPPDPDVVINGGPRNSALVEIEAIGGLGSVIVSVNDVGQIRAK